MRYLAVLALAACGANHSQPTPDASSVDAPVTLPPTTYHAMLDQTAAVPFGGSPYCNYTITLKQLDVSITIQSTGRISGATVQDLNIEGVVMPCPYTASPPSIADYAFASEKPVSGGTEITFTGAAANSPAVTLTALLQRSGSSYSAQLDFQRTDQAPVLNWKVDVTLALAPQ